ncbi:MAG: NAD(P)-dependent alcohol dehydrogenase [Actinomycetota bacterium]|nr:NAD(P)-dependent alcohol dehydrogenase [Actinomycetota bacterium]
MKAAVGSIYGPPEVVQVRNIPEPITGEHDVLIKVHLATVNRTDCGFRSGKPAIVRLFSGLARPKFTVLGTEFAGVIESIGGQVSRFAVGDRIFGYNEGGWGAHAEYLSIAEDGPLATIPSHLSFAQAVASTEASHYALASIRKTGVRNGDDVLVYGATGAIGSAAVQLLKVVGANVVAVCDTQHIELVKGLGADRVIDRLAEDFTKDEQRFDLVFDAVGKSTFGKCKPLLKPRGIYATTDLGPWAQNPILALTTPLLRSKKAMLPIPQSFDRELAEYFRGLIDSGQFKPVIDRAYPLDEIVDAYRYVETGQKIGNVLLTIVDED